MESTRLFALLLAPIVLGIPLFAAAEEGATREAGGPALATAEGPRLAVFEGASLLRVRGACPEGLRCVGANEVESGAFLLGGGGSLARAVVTWTPVDREHPRLRVGIHGTWAEGASPLTLELGTLPAGRHRVEVAAAPGAKGTYDQRVDWAITAFVQETPSPVHVEGTSGYELGVGCAKILAGCDPATRLDEGRFLAPWPAREAALFATWESGRTLRWEIAGRSIESASPLRLDLGALPADEHAVRVTPARGGLPQETESVRWHVALVR